MNYIFTIPLPTFQYKIKVEVGHKSTLPISEKDMKIYFGWSTQKIHVTRRQSPMDTWAYLGGTNLHVPRLTWQYIPYYVES